MGLSLVFLFTNCDSGPKVISSAVDSNSSKSSTGSTGSTGIFDGAASSSSSSSSNQSGMSDVHTVTVNEILPTEKYVYLNVNEADEKFWIATGKQEVVIGEKYFFKGGLLKTNFESKEYNRVFNKVFLVSKLVPLKHGNPSKHGGKSEKSASKTANNFKLTFDHGKEFVKIADLVNNPSKYAGKKIKMTGQCTKMNANIMGKNWIHLKDGTKDDYDMVLTSSTAVPEGHIIKVEGTVSLDKDFGSGYRYNILVEDAIMIND